MKGRKDGWGRRAGLTWLIGPGTILCAMLVATGGVAQQAGAPASSGSNHAQPAASSPPAASAPVPMPDVVVRKDGSMVRGTIFDRNEGEVTIQLPTGQMRTIPMSNVTYAGPEAEMPKNGAARGGRRGVEQGSTVTLELMADVPEATFFLRPGAAGHQALCTAPCVATIPAGRHHFAVAQGRSQAIEVEGAMNVSRDSLVTARYDSRAGVRATGWTILGVGLFAGLLVATSTASENCESGSSGSCSLTMSKTHLAVGAGLMAIGLGVGIPLTTIGDKVSISVAPMDSNAATRERGSQSLLPEGAAVTGRF